MSAALRLHQAHPEAQHLRASSSRRCRRARPTSWPRWTATTRPQAEVDQFLRMILQATSPVLRRRASGPCSTAQPPSRTWTATASPTHAQRLTALCIRRAPHGQGSAEIESHVTHPIASSPRSPGRRVPARARVAYAHHEKLDGTAIRAAALHGHPHPVADDDHRRHLRPLGPGTALQEVGAVDRRDSSATRPLGKLDMQSWTLRGGQVYELTLARAGMPVTAG